MGAEACGRGARAGAEVEGGDGEAATLQTHHIWPTWRPVLHVAQIQAVIQHCMAAPAGGTATINHGYIILLLSERLETHLNYLFPLILTDATCRSIYLFVNACHRSISFYFYFFSYAFNCSDSTEKVKAHRFIMIH